MLLESVLRKIINETFIINEDDKFISANKERLGNALLGKINGSEQLKNDAENLGINLNYDDAEREQYKNNIYSKRSNNIKSKPINKKLIAVIDVLKQNTLKDGSIKLDKLEPIVNSDQHLKDVGVPNFNAFMRIKDFIDSQDLRYLYDPSVLNSKVPKFGITKNPDGSFNYSNLDINDVSFKLKDDKFMKSYYDSKTKTYDYKKAETVAKNTLLERYLITQYGIKMSAPSFSLGNQKVVNTMIINFTSAFRCPAWNECLVKHACYARAGEGKNFENIKSSNDKKNLMWLAADKDEQLLSYIYSYIKSYIFAWGKIQKELINIDQKYANDEEIKNLIDREFSSLNENEINVIKANKRVSDIRLNENGDFINQTLLESFDEMAKDFKICGVNTSAYSCRNLNFDKIKNIVINASRGEMKGSAIARYFYALPKKMYDAFPDTYNGMNIKDTFNAIERTPKPLYKIDFNTKQETPTNNLYYKCPCGRADFSIEGKEDNPKINCYQCHLCYEAPDDEIKRILGNNGKLFVFVKAHGANANVLDDKRERQVIMTVGAPKGYQTGVLKSDGSDYEFDTDLNMESRRYGNKRIDEQIGNGILSSMENEAYKTIVGNAVYSMTEKFRGLGQGLEIESKFKSMMNKINEIDTRNKPTLID
jgi:hypothetical protein